jgi:hypothetical protein
MMDDLMVEVESGNIIVSHLPTGMIAEYYKPKSEPQLILRRRSPTKDYALLALLLSAANDKARELGLIA